MKKAIEVKRGTFQLTCAVENPKPRKRATHWYQEAGWQAGARFVIGDYPIARGEVAPYLRRPNREHDGIGPHDPLFWLIVDHLEEIDEEPSDFLKRVRWLDLAPKILDRLFRNKVITLDDVRGHMENELSMDEELANPPTEETPE